MTPSPGERLLRFVGDRVRFGLQPPSGVRVPPGCRAYLRTNLGRAHQVRQEIIAAYTNRLPSAGASWRDIAMRRQDEEWWIELPLTEVGFFQAKAYWIDADGRQFWPEGGNVGISIHPDQFRTTNTIYCAFTRLFGETKSAPGLIDEPLEAQLTKLDKRGYTVIPPSGKLRDLVRHVGHIVDTLGFRVLQLLPVNPTPTTYARFGRFGSPYAAQDLTAVDPALVEFDRRTTGIDQFRELTYEAHLRGARVFLDIATNHTGWGSNVQENHPDWFLREPDGRFASPGAWGTTWEDLVELNHRNPASWAYLAEVLLTWCRRGVDGFRCDAGYKVPMPAWRYIAACVRQEYPETLCFLEGLGGSWEATETLLTEGEMQWAYSELFQNYSGTEIAAYLDYAHRQSHRVGLYTHYSETHDNDRLAKKGRGWSLLRNQLSALTSVSGAYGITCGVEWLATAKINVHSSRGLNWDATDSLIPEFARLNKLLGEHPCFFDHANLTRLSASDSPVYALRRDSDEGKDRVLVLINTDLEKEQSFVLSAPEYEDLGRPGIDLLGGVPPRVGASTGKVVYTLAPGAAFCLSNSPRPAGLAGDAYRQARAAAAFAVRALGHFLPSEEVGKAPWRALAERVHHDPVGYLAALQRLDVAEARNDLLHALDCALHEGGYPPVAVWEIKDVRRVMLIPHRHWLLVRDAQPFRATLNVCGSLATHEHSIMAENGHVVFFPPVDSARDAQLFLERYGQAPHHVEARIRFLGDHPGIGDLRVTGHREAPAVADSPLILLTNGRGGMVRLRSDFGRVNSKYDCLLGANLHPSVPVDRHVLAKRCRAWLIADRFISQLDRFNLVSCEPGPPACWRFIANAGDGRTVEVRLEADMLERRNSVVLRFSRPEGTSSSGRDLPEGCDVRLTVRIDIEDRNFHWETKRNSGAEHHFTSNTRPLTGKVGFEFTPASDRKLVVFADMGEYHHESEWSENIPHSVEASRGQEAQGDAYSPGWFDLPLIKGKPVTIVVSADADLPGSGEIERFSESRVAANRSRLALVNLDPQDDFGRRLALAAQQFLVRRGEGKTVIAGYPWFLDWGRDTLICGRGLLSAGFVSEVRDILLTFARFEEKGTLPNSIWGEDASNRDTSDAPLWFGVLCEEAAALLPGSIYDVVVDRQGRTVRQVLRSIAENYHLGTPNGIHTDAESGLVWSPSHFTWMDTNYPAGTPREGYPVEIQVLWIRLLRQLARIDPADRETWAERAARAQASLTNLYWLEKDGYFADCLLGSLGQGATAATPDTALRSNYLFGVSLGLITGEQARRAVSAALEYLVVPGALRSLAPLPVSPPLPIFGPEGKLLNNPQEPYAGRYEGDEDTRRKPAYHNGTAWTWTFPTFCEALALAWDSSPEALAAALGFLSSSDRLLKDGCLGQLPEIVDGDAPHQQRGCDAQAWAVTEVLRVWQALRARLR